MLLHIDVAQSLENVVPVDRLLEAFAQLEFVDRLCHAGDEFVSEFRVLRNGFLEEARGAPAAAGQVVVGVVAREHCGQGGAERLGFGNEWMQC